MFAFAAVLAAGCARPEAAVTSSAEPQPVVVTTAPVETRPIQRTVTAVGTFYGNDEVALAVKVDGRVKRVRFEAGATVKPGDVLLELEDTDYRLSVEEMKRGLEAELAKLGLDHFPAGELDIDAVPAVARASFTLLNAARKHERAKSLRSTGGMSKDDFEQCETDFKVAQAMKLEAVTNARATLANARSRKAALDTAEQKLLDTRLIVPTPLLTVAADRKQSVEYVIAERMVTEGEMVRSQPVTNAFRLVMDQPLKLRANVPERYFGEVKAGQKAQLRVEAYPDEAFEGSVTLVRPTVDPVSRTFMVEILVPNEPRRLKAGGFAKAAVLTHVDPAAVTVPVEAVVSFAGVNKVFVVGGGKVKAVEVKTGVEGNEVLPGGRVKRWVEVAGELSIGAAVVTSGHSQLVDGTAVKVR
jgi:RND family efflux transporter MFP subunit